MNAVTLTSSFPATVQPGIPKLGEKPSGWVRAPLGRYLKEVRRPLKMNDDEEYRLVTVKRARGGVVERERLTGREISVKSQFLIEAGDFLISKRQIVHGACGLVPEDLAGSIVSNEYAVLNGREGIDLQFLNYLAHSIFFQQTCFHSSIGVHVEKMIFKLDRWLKWEFDVPPIPEQRKIAEILSTWDRAIDKSEALLAAARTQKRAIMQTLLTGKRRFPEFEGQEWIEVLLGDVASIDWGNTSITKASYVEDGFCAYSASGQDGKVANFEMEGPGIVLSAIGARCGRCFWADGRWTAIKNTIVIRGRNDRTDIRFLYQVLNNPRFWPISGGAQPFIGLKNARTVKLKMPPISEQTQIANMLSNCDKEIFTLEGDIEKLRAEKKALMQQLLTGKRRVRT